MSIIPGIETGAPERTDTRRGRGPPPNLRPVRASRSATAVVTSSMSPSGSAPVSMYSRHASVVMTKPGGTGSPAAVMRARPAPLPPRTDTWAGSASPKA